MAGPTHIRRVLHTIDSENELLGQWVEVGIGGLAPRDGVKVLLHLESVLLCQVGHHLLRLQHLDGRGRHDFTIDRHRGRP